MTSGDTWTRKMAVLMPVSNTIRPLLTQFLILYVVFVSLAVLIPIQLIYIMFSYKYSCD